MKCKCKRQSQGQDRGRLKGRFEKRDYGQNQIEMRLDLISEPAFCLREINPDEGGKIVR